MSVTGIASSSLCQYVNMSVCQYVSMSVCQSLIFFSKTAHMIYLEFYLKLQKVKVQKLIKPNFFRKIIILGKMP